MYEKRGTGIGNTTNGTYPLSSVMQICRLLNAQKSTVDCSVIVFNNRAVWYFVYLYIALSSPPRLSIRFPWNVAIHLNIVYWRLYGYIYALFKHYDLLVSSHVVIIIATKWNNIFWFLICYPCLTDIFTNILHWSTF